MLFYLTTNVFSSHMQLFIQANLAPVLPRTAKHLSTTDLRLYCAPGRDSARSELLHGQKMKKRKSTIKLDGLPASIPVAYLQNTKHQDHAIFGNKGTIDSHLS
jgi:hypothetical protein